MNNTENLYFLAEICLLTTSSSCNILADVCKREIRLIEKKRNKKICEYCKTEKTPLWRYGPNGNNTLCNRCGLKYSRQLTKYKTLSQKVIY
jgi:hypothetical protein